MRARFEREKEEATRMMREQCDTLRGLFSEGRVLFDEPMSKHSTMGVGGPAEAYVVVNDEEELKSVISFADENGIDYHFWGAGSNVLVRDGGLRGIVIRLGIGFESIKIDRDSPEGVYVYVGSAVPTPRFVNWCSENGISGIEWLAGMPSTVGGNVAMNAGMSETSMSDVVEEVTIVNRECKILSIRKKALRFEYRKLKIPRTAVISRSLLKLKRDNPAGVVTRAQKFFEKRRGSQPQGVKSLGCIFKNSGKTSAGMLIDEAGLKGVRVGGARISDMHANFIFNENAATAKDVLVLMSLIRDRVKQYSGIVLENEIIIVGDK